MSFTAIGELYRCRLINTRRTAIHILQQTLLYFSSQRLCCKEPNAPWAHLMWSRLLFQRTEIKTVFVTGKNEGWKALIIILGENVCCRRAYALLSYWSTVPLDRLMLQQLGKGQIKVKCTMPLIHTSNARRFMSHDHDGTFLYKEKNQGKSFLKACDSKLCWSSAFLHAYFQLSS